MPVLTGIFNALGFMAQAVATGVVTALNAVVSSVAGLVGVFVGLLPDMPAAPAPPSGGWVSWLTWLVPLGALVGALTTFVGVWLAYLLVRVPLRWLRVL